MKATNLSDGARCWPTTNGPNLGLINCESPDGNNVSNEQSMISAKLTLIRCGKKLFLPQNYANFPKVLNMNIKVSIINMNVTKLNNKLFFISMKVLGGWGIG